MSIDWKYLVLVKKSHRDGPTVNRTYRLDNCPKVVARSKFLQKPNTVRTLRRYERSLLVLSNDASNLVP